MEATATSLPELTVIEDPLTGFDGELTPENLDLLVGRVRELDDLRIRQAEELDERADKIKGLQGTITSQASRITKLKRNKEKEACASNTWPIAERLYRIWWVGTGKRARKKLSYDRFEKIEPFLRDARPDELGYDEGPPRNATEECAAAIVGRITDHFKQKRPNGSVKHYWEWDRIFKSSDEMEDSRDRRPRNWRELLKQWDGGES